MTYIKTSSDIFIKYLFGSENNKDLLLSFINAVLEDAGFQKIVDVEIKNPFNIKTFALDKESVLDIKARDENGRYYNIEVQSSGNETFKQRALYYWARLYASQINEGEHYTVLKPTITINVLDFILIGENDRCHNVFLLREKTESDLMLTDHLLIHFLELPKLRTKMESENLIDNPLYRWLIYLLGEREMGELLKVIIKEDDTIAKAHKEYEKFTQNDEYREIYEARMKWKADKETLIYAARQEGIEKGRKEAWREKALEDARKMRMEGLNSELIHRITGLSLEEIENL